METPTTKEKPKKKKKSNAGRPSEFTQDVVNKLEEAFAMDCTVGEACLFAGISTKTYYNNVKEGSELLHRFDTLRDKPILLARQTVMKKMSESYGNAMDYLSRKKKLEFSQKQEVELSGKVNISSILDDIEKPNERPKTS